MEQCRELLNCCEAEMTSILSAPNWTICMSFLLMVALALQEIELDLILDVSTKLHHCNVILSDLDYGDMKTLSESLSNSVVVIMPSSDMELPEQTEMFFRQSSRCQLLFLDAKQGKSQHILHLDYLKRVLHTTVYKQIVIFVDSKERIPPSFLVYNGLSFIVNPSRENHLYIFKSTSVGPRINLVWHPQNNSVIPFKTCHPTFSFMECSLKGRQVQLSVVGEYPYVIKSDDNRKILGGIDPDMMQLVATKIGCYLSYKTEVHWRRQLENKTWIGAFGSVMYGQSQLGVGTILMSNAHQLPIDFTNPVYPLDLSLLGPKPKPLTPYENILRPFSTIVWLTLFLAFIANGIIIVIFFVVDRLLLSRRQLLQSNVWYYYVVRAFLISLGTLCCQSVGMAKRPKTIIFSAYLAVWIICVLLIEFAYESNLRANLVRIEFEKTIETVQDILDADKDLFLYKGTEIYNTFRFGTTAASKRVYQRIQERKTFRYLDATDGVREYYNKIIDTGAVQSTILQNVEFTLEWWKRDLGYQPFKPGKTVIMPFHGCYIMEKYKPWQFEVRQALNQMVEGGIMARTMSGYKPLRFMGMINDEPDVKIITFTIEHIMGAIIVLASGTSIAFVVVLAEMCSYYQL